MTGGLGFIGSNLVCELEKRGYETCACDLMHSWQPNYVRCDVSQFSQVERLFESMTSITFILIGFFMLSTAITLYAITRISKKPNNI